MQGTHREKPSIARKKLEKYKEKCSCADEEEKTDKSKGHKFINISLLEFTAQILRP